MRLGIYLGRHCGKGGGIGVYLRALLDHIPEVLVNNGSSVYELVIYGDRSILDEEVLALLDPGEDTSVWKVLLKGANSSVSAECHGMRPKIVVRFLGSSLGRHLGLFFDQLLLPLVFHRDRLELVHSTSNVGILLSKIPQVVTVHDLFQAWPPESGDLPKEAKNHNRPLGGITALRGRFIRMLYRIIFKRQFSRLQFFITDTCQTALEIVRRYGVDNQRITTIPLGLDRTFSVCSPLAPGFDNRSAAWLSNLGITPGYLLLPVSADPRKNSYRALAAWLRLPDSIKDRGLLITCPDHRSHRVLESVLGNQVYRQGVRIIDWLRRQDLPYLYKSAACLLMPSLAEGYGLPVIECLSVGTAVVCAELEAVETATADSELVFYCDPLDIDSIAQALSQAMEAAGPASLSAAARFPVQGQASSQRRTFRTMEEVSVETVLYYEDLLRSLSGKQGGKGDG